MLGLTIKEAELVRGLCAKGRVSVSDSDLVKVASLLPRQMLKEAGAGVNINPSKVVQKMNGALGSIKNLVAPKKTQLSADALKKLTNDNLQAASNEPLGLFGRISRWFRGGGPSKSQIEMATNATNAGMTYADYTKKLNKFRQLDEAMRTGGISQSNYDTYGQLARELGIFTGNGGATPISQETFNTLQNAANHLGSTTNNIQNIVAEKENLAKQVKQLTTDNRHMNKRITKMTSDNANTIANLQKQHQDELTNLNNNFNATRQQEATQRQMQEMQNQIDSYKNKRWYQDPATAAAVGVGGTLAGIGGLNAAGNMAGAVFGGNRGYDDRRGRGPVIIS